MRNAQIEIADIAGQVDSLRHALELQMDELRARQAELAEQIRSVQHAVAALEIKKPEPVVAAPAPKAETAKTEPKADVAPAKATAPEAISEEIMLVIAAAVAAFLGKSARVRSARYVHEGQSPWAQQGRVFVQASHNLVHHG
jgi:methylmalonyl-CoA carboxyltransferase large subunit